MKRATLLIWILRLGLAALYLFAAVPKLLDPWTFARAIGNFRILPIEWVPPVAVWLPAFEGMAALAILTGVFYRGGIVAVVGMSAAFAAGISSAMIRGLDIDCGCFGAAAHSRANIPHLALNLGGIMAGLTLLAASARRKRRPLSRR